MSIKEIEAAALKLVPKDRARLAGKSLKVWRISQKKRTNSSGLKKRSGGIQVGTQQRMAAELQDEFFATRVQNLVDDAGFFADTPAGLRLSPPARAAEARRRS